MNKPETQPQQQEGPELKPCPFCGVIPKRRDHVYRYGSIAEHPEGSYCVLARATIGVEGWQSRADLPRATSDDRDRFLTHFLVTIEPFYEKKHGRVPPTQGALWELLMFVQHKLEAAPRATAESDLTVESALRELREMFPDWPTKIEITTDGIFRVWFWPGKLATVESMKAGRSLMDCINQVRAWSKSRAATSEAEGE